MKNELRLKELIDGRMTQRELAQRLGVRENTLNQWVNNRNDPPTGFLPLIAKTLGVTVDELYDDLDKYAKRENT
ncbi:MAG TPA: helix-turn-helix transcriptional regulator [Clostridia bacterium]|nr:helix-turn-helix transcriptional regulator [Clostridia bacterium]